MQIFKHANGFYRVYFDFRVYFHVWTAPAVSDIHDHRKSFTSSMHMGRLREDAFVKSDDGSHYYHHKITSSATGYKPVSSSPAVLTLNKMNEYKTGDFVVRPSDMIHQVTPLEFPTVTLITEFDAVRTESGVYTTSETFEATPMSPVTVDETREVTAILDFVINRTRSSSSSSSD